MRQPPQLGGNDMELILQDFFSEEQVQWLKEHAEMHTLDVIKHIMRRTHCGLREAQKQAHKLHTERRRT